jgi:hypothetical protein
VHENQQIFETVSVRHETSSHAPTRCGASGQWILGVLVQSTYAVAVEPDLIDFQIGVQKKLRWELLDYETDGVRGAGKCPYPSGCRQGLRPVVGSRSGSLPVGNNSASAA